MQQLLTKSVDPRVYIDPLQFRDDYQAVSFLKKTPFRVPGIDPKVNATEKFFEAEKACGATNRRIRNFLSDPSKVSDVVRKAFCFAHRKIEKILGEVDYVEWLSSCRFGPGVFNSPVHSGLTSIYDKLQVSPTVTHDFAESGAVLVTSSPHWARSVTGIEDDGFWPIIRDTDLIKVPGNRVTFVPKTAVTDRAIAIEPLLNIYAQLGIGAMIRRRLQRTGIDLDDQSHNQSLALWGSIDGSLATIDLSSASDTVAKELVRALLPESWFKIMDATRSKTGKLDEQVIQYEKFSSMGNGFTFELETLIFLGLTLAACEVSHVSPAGVRVYGDDIIVPVGAYDVLEEVLTFFGFSLNRAKSFKEGNFRESCGKDYYDGIDVRPYFCKSLPERVDSLFALANGIRRCAKRRRGLDGCDIRLYKPWRSVVRELPKSLANHCRVPAHAGDTAGLVSNWDEAQVSNFVVPSRDGWEGYYGLRYQPKPLVVREANNFLGVVASLLYKLKGGSIGTNRSFIEGSTPWNAFPDVGLGNSSPVSPRLGRDFSYQLQDRAFYGPWSELGPWV